MHEEATKANTNPNPRLLQTTNASM